MNNSLQRRQRPAWRQAAASAAAAQPASLPGPGHAGPGQAPALEPEHESAADRVCFREADGHRVAQREFLA